MSDKQTTNESRRRFVTLVSGGAVIVPLAGLTTACGGESSAPEPAAPAPKPMADSMSDAMSKPAATMEAATEKAENAMETAAAKVEEATQDMAAAAPTAGDMPKLEESDAQATALNYVHDATTSAATTRYAAGQACSNCALYQGAADSEWGACPLFAGKMVKSTGWCSGYGPKAG